MVKVKYKGYISQKKAVSGAFVFHNHILFFTYLQYESFENTEGKGEIARNEQFLLFP